MNGSCLCRSVLYQVKRFSGSIVHCHCRTCQKAHAAIFTSTARVKRVDFIWLKGEEKLGAYESSVGKIRRFCTQCGTQIIAEWLDQDEVILRVVTLDDEPDVSAKAHIWKSHDLEWLDYDTSL